MVGKLGPQDVQLVVASTTGPYGRLPHHLMLEIACSQEHQVVLRWGSWAASLVTVPGADMKTARWTSDAADEASSSQLASQEHLGDCILRPK